MNEKRAAIYCRISADHQGQSLGVTRQESECRELAERYGYEHIRVYTDNDISAYSGRPRPEYRKMLRDIDNGRIDAVFAWHTDRLFRRAVDMTEFIETIDRAKIPVHTVTAGEMDLTTAQGKLVARIAGSVAAHEVEHAKERLIAAHKQKAFAGKWRGGRGGSRVFGYTVDGSAVVEREAEAIRDAVSKALDGVSSTQIAREWNDAGVLTVGGRKWDSRRIVEILRSPRYAGLATYRGEVVGPGEWPAIIAEDDHRALLGRLSKRRTGTRPPRRWQGVGAYVCGRCLEAGERRTVGTRQGAGVMKGTQLYTCRRFNHLSRQARAVDEYVDSLVLARLSMPDAHLLVEPEGADDLATLRNREDALRARLDELASLFAEGAITGEQLRTGTQQLRADIEAVEQRIREVSGTDPLAELVVNRDIWSELPAEKRSAIINILCEVVILPAKKGTRGFDPNYIRVTWKR